MGVISTETFDQEDNQHDLTHWHDKIEVIRVIDHEMYCAVNGTEHFLHKGDICIINCRQLHRIYCMPDGICTFQRLMIDPALFTADKVVYEKYILPMLSDETFAHIHGMSGNKFTSEISNIMEGIADLEQLMPLAYELKVIALMFMLVQRLYQYYEASKGKVDALVNPDILLYRRITDFITQNYAEKLTLDIIASSGNISKSKCCALFKEYAGHSPIDFVNLYRLKVSTDLLKHSAESIASIAAACGFGQQSYYNRLFLREYGMTPKEYRDLDS